MPRDRHNAVIVSRRLYAASKANITLVLGYIAHDSDKKISSLRIRDMSRPIVDVHLTKYAIQTGKPMTSTLQCRLHHVP